MHWADQFAKQIVERSPDKGEYIVESGITPSGTVHAGNFREIITQDFVYRALLRRGVDAKYNYVWDDYDRFRKVPAGVPPEWEQYIGIPVSKTPDPWGCHGSYSEHFEDPIVKECQKCGIFPSFIKMSEEYERCAFAEEMKIALDRSAAIRGILNKFRKEPLSEKWLPIRVYCEKCGKDTTKARYLGEYVLQYKCACGNGGKFDFRKKGIAKMVWRVCWAQRWKHYGVDFESSGKDHQASGGSWDTGTRICKRVFRHEPPIGPMYEFIYAKGQKEKMSSSEGNVFTVSDLLSIYEPQIVRWIYTAKISKAIEVPFDQGVHNYYNYYDQAERVFFGKEKVPEEDAEQLKRCYGLSQIGEPKEAVQPPFSFLADISQITKSDKDAVGIMQRTGHLPKGLSKHDLERVSARLKLAGNWASRYMPEESRISLQESMPDVKLSQGQRGALHALGNAFEKIGTVEQFQEEFGKACESASIKPKELFEAAYLVLLNRARGPRLAHFALSLDPAFVAKRFMEA